MKRTIKIDGIDVPMKASAASPRIYRNVIGKDLFLELQELSKAYQNDEPLNIEVVENMAYLFAYQANENIPNIEEWLDQFGATAIFQAMPEILALWEQNAETKSTAKK